MRINPIQFTSYNYKAMEKSIACAFAPKINFGNSNVDKNVLKDRYILKKDEDINTFFNSISKKLFKNFNDEFCFSALLKSGTISLSSSCYMNLDNPYSAIALKFDENKQDENLKKSEKYIKEGLGIGVNFSNFNNPIDEILRLNGYFKKMQPALCRPPAGIALLNINHSKILDFITLKDNADYNDWCFDLSVVLDDDFLSKVDKDEEITLSDGKKTKAKTIYNTLLNSMLKKGEPAVVFSHHPDYICDSCNAAELKENETLTLGQINLSKIYNKNTKDIDYNLLKKSCSYLSKAMKKIDNNSYIGILGYSDLLKKLNIEYGTPDALSILDNCLKIIKKEANNYSLKMAISPTGTISRLLKTTPSIEPKEHTSYRSQIDTMATAQKYLDGGISKTIILDESATIEDVDYIIRNSAKKGLRGISVF